MKKKSTPLVKELIDLGFKPYSAKAMVALLDMGKGNSVQIAEAAGIPRTSVYGVMKDLVDRSLAAPALGYGPTLWEVGGTNFTERWSQALVVLSLEAEQALHEYHMGLARLADKIQVSAPVSA